MQLQLLFLLTLASLLDALSLQASKHGELSRRNWVIAAGFTATLQQPASSLASDNLDMTDAQLKELIKSDIIDRQFLATGQLTPSIYRPDATFTDEIDTYGLEQWQRGTQKLFVGSKSTVRLVGDVNVTPAEVKFRFDEDLCFNIPLLQPIVSLSGTVVLSRDDDGYITSYREYWDQDVSSVLKTAKFGGGK